MLLDSHCHLNDEVYDTDLPKVLEHMALNGVGKAMLVSLNPEDLAKARKIAYPGISFKLAYGVFPEDYGLDKKELDKRLAIMGEKDIVAIGEIGLDYHWYKEAKEAQKELFITQLKRAQDLAKPVIIHSREALQDTYDILKAYPCRGVLHCYSGSLEMAREFIKLGYYLSFGGVITFKNARNVLEVAREIPLDKLLIETDSPYLTPVPYRGQRNMPGHVKLVAEKICEVRGITAFELEEAVNANYDLLFGKSV